MFLFPAAGLIGLGLGYLRGGSLSSLASFSFRHTWLVAVAVALQVGQGHGPFKELGGGAHRAIVLLSYGAVGAWLMLNAPGRTPALRGGISLVAVGFALNVAVIAANGAMPVSQPALDHVGEGRAPVTETQLWKHVRASPDTVFSGLGDNIPVPGPEGIRSVVSIGDIVMLLGLALALGAAMTEGEPEPALSGGHP
jgi:hypothetical protein